MQKLIMLTIILLSLYPKVYGLELELDITTIPEKLVSNSKALLVIKYNINNNIAPFMPEIDNILSSDTNIVKIDISTLRVVGNNLVVNLDIIKSGNTTITVIPKEGKPISKVFDIEENSNIPNDIIMKIRPESFSYLGPHKGYISIELVNAQGFPLIADKDYIIELSSSNKALISLDNMIISKGNYFGIKEFSINGYGESTIMAKYGNLIKESKISVEDPYKDLNLKLYIAPNIAPAMNGQRVYAFIQLQNSKGEPIYAKQDTHIEIKSFTNDIITKSAILKANESTAIAELIINTDKPCKDNFCIEIYATINGIKSNSAYLKLTDYIKYNQMEFSKYNNTKIMPVLFPNDMPILADGKEKVIGVIQLMSVSNQFNMENAKAVIPMHNIIIESNTKGLVNIINNLVIEKPYSTTLVNAKVGYLADDEKLEFFGDKIHSYNTNLKLYGHKNIKLVAEPMIDKIKSNTNFPYIIYFVDDQNKASYIPEDLNLMIFTNNNIVSIEPKYIKKGSDNILLNAYAFQSGNVNITFDLINYKASSSLNIIEEDNSFLLNIPDKIIRNSKVLASIQTINKDGSPICLKDDINVYLYTSNNLINIPKSITIPAEKCYATFIIEAYNNIGTTDLNVFIDNSKSYNKSIEIIDDNIKLILEKENDLKVNEQFKLTLKAYYNDQQLENAKVTWNNTKGLLIEYDDVIKNGTANAKYLIKDLGEHIFTAKISYEGIERESKIVLSSIEEPIINNTINEPLKSLETVTNNTLNTIDNSIGFKLPIDSLPVKIEYILLIPAIASIVISLLKSKRKRG